MDLSQSNVVVVIFTMNGCPACADYMPRLRAAAKSYPEVPIVRYDIESKDEHVQALADRLGPEGVQGLPTTAIMRRGSGMLVLEGALSDQDIHRALRTAKRCQYTGRL